MYVPVFSEQTEKAALILKDIPLFPDVFGEHFPSIIVCMYFFVI